MGLILTPGQLERRANLYHQLAALVRAGVPLIQAVDSIRRSPPTPADSELLQKVGRSLQEGLPFTDALAMSGSGASELDIALLRAGEESGQLDQTFEMLHEYYRERAGLLKEVYANLAYPVLLLHLVILILPFPDLFLSGDVWRYLQQTLGVLIPLYAGVGLLVWAVQGPRSEKARALVESIVRRVPLVGTAQHQLALARLAAALEALIRAGISIIPAWQLAASASGSPNLKRTVASWRKGLEAGQTPGEVVASSGQFPQLFASLYQTGELSGDLDATLRRLYRYYREEGSVKLRTVARWAPRLFYFLVLGLVAYHVISFWLDYFSRLSRF